MKRLGLIVNPVAGLGGRVGLKGSDGVEIQRRAVELGAVPHALDRSAQALAALIPLRTEFELLTCSGVMGEDAAEQAGLAAQVIDSSTTGPTSAADTIRAAREMVAKGIDLLLFAGGDGTARDIVSAIGTRVPVLGIPAGVKIHSAVYATHPRSAGELTRAYLRGETQLHQAEVMDLDEDAFRAGRVSPKLFGYLTMPYLQRYVQGVKAPSVLSEPAALEAIAEDLKERMKPGWLYIFGPGSTTHTVASHLGLNKTMLGVDALLDGEIVAADATERDLLHLLAGYPAEIIVTPIGGQGCIFGRGNQQISPEVIRKVGRAHVRVISTREKLQALNGAALWADTGDGEVDELLGGYFAVIVGYKESVMYKVTA